MMKPSAGSPTLATCCQPNKLQLRGQCNKSKVGSTLTVSFCCVFCMFTMFIFATHTHKDPHGSQSVSQSTTKALISNALAQIATKQCNQMPEQENCVVAKSLLCYDTNQQQQQKRLVISLLQLRCLFSIKAR